VCATVCPVDAVFQDDRVPEKWRHYAEINKNYFAKAPANA
jgi:hypothetical protein